RAYTRGTLNGDVLQGDLIIRGEGDPKLVTEKFWQFLRQIRAAGIREIHGNLILDRSIYRAEAHDAGAFDAEPLKPYNVGPDALLLNYNVLTMRFRPDAAQRTVSLQFDPPVAWSPAQVRTPVLSNGACGDWQSALRPQFGAQGLWFEGSYPSACGERGWYVHPYMMAATDYFGLVFRQLWAEIGGTFSGAVIDGVTPADAQQVAEWQSPALPEIV